jgi:hypothetical protein
MKSLIDSGSDGRKKKALFLVATPIRPKQHIHQLAVRPYREIFWIFARALLLLRQTLYLYSFLPFSSISSPAFQRCCPRWCALSTAPPIMAGTTLAMRSMASPSIMRLSAVSRRTIATTSQALRPKPLRSNGLSIARVARRGYADAAPTPLPAPKPKKRFRALRWAWRLTWLSALGLTGAMAYSIYELRHPEEQFEPDPTKKTLVILGMS